MKKLSLICLFVIILGIIGDGLLVGGRVELLFFFLLVGGALASFIFGLSSKYHYQIALFFLILGMCFSLGKNQFFKTSSAEIFLKYVYFFLILGLIKEKKFD